MGVTILRMSDRVKVTVGEISFLIAPLSGENKREVLSLMSRKSGTVSTDLHAAASIYLKHGLKSVTGVKDYNKQDYTLEFSDGSLTNDSVDEVMMLGESESLMSVAWGLLNGLPDKSSLPEGVKLEVTPRQTSSG